MTDPTISKTPRMVSSHSTLLQFLCGKCGMEIVFLLVLTVSLTVASPLRRTQKPEPELALLETAVRTVGVERSEEEQEQHAPPVKIVPFQSDYPYLELDALKHSGAGKLRPRRAPQRGCQLGTCQLHNLANTLYHISKTSGKEESKNAHDPQGYGR